MDMPSKSNQIEKNPCQIERAINCHSLTTSLQGGQLLVVLVSGEEKHYNKPLCTPHAFGAGRPDDDDNVDCTAE
jgi:hypothetical protein